MNRKWPSPLAANPDEKRRKKYKGGPRSPCPGVTLFYGGRWRANICINGVTRHIGMFNTRDEAIAARLKAEELHHMHYIDVRRKHGKTN